jgi:hypothetical protein
MRPKAPIDVRFDEQPYVRRPEPDQPPEAYAWNGSSMFDPISKAKERCPFGPASLLANDEQPGATAPAYSLGNGSP